MRTKTRESFDNAILTVRFTGPRLEKSGVSIYDLGTTLLALQRIVHKGYLAREDRLEKGTFPTRQERPSLALQLGDRRRQSDAFALVPILTDPSTLQAMRDLATYIGKGLVPYFTKKVMEQLSADANSNRRIFIGAIHAQVVNIVDRIDASGGVEGIAIGSPATGHQVLAAFDGDTREYVANLKNEKFLGNHQEISGHVYRMYPNSNIVTIRRSKRRNVNVFLSDADFRRIRYNRDGKEMFTFTGRPIYRLGVESRSITEFEADSVERMKDEDEG